MAEGVHCVHIVGQLADVAAILQLDTFGNGDDDAGLLLLHHTDLLDEVIHVEGHFGQTDHVHALAVVTLGQRSGSGQPASVAAHDLDHGDVLGAVHGGVTDDLLHHDADVLGGGAVAGGVVGNHQVVGHAHEADVALDAVAVIGQLADGVHGVVAADIEEIADVQLLQNGEQLLIDGLIVVPIGQLVAAAAQEAGRRALEQLDVEVVGQILREIYDVFLQQTGHAVAHAVNDLRAAVLAALKDPRQTGVDDGSRAAGLANDCIFTHDDFSFSSVSALYYRAGARKQTVGERNKPEVTGGCGAGCR